MRKELVVLRNQFISCAVALSTLAAVVPADAGPLEDAQAALAAGDSVKALQLIGTLIDQDDTRLAMAEASGYLFVKGSATEEETLQRAHVGAAARRRGTGPVHPGCSARAERCLRPGREP